MPLKAQQLIMTNVQDNNIIKQTLQGQHHHHHQQQQQQQKHGYSYVVFPDELNTINWDRNRIWAMQHYNIKSTSTTTPTKKKTQRQQQQQQQQLQPQWLTTTNPLNVNNGNNRNSSTRMASSSANASNGRQSDRNKPFIVYVNNRPIIPTSIPFWSSTTTPTPQYLNCLQQCPTTTEFNPVCANNRQTYHNEQKFHCAKYCGANIKIVHRGNCE